MECIAIVHYYEGGVSMFCAEIEQVSLSHSYIVYTCRRLIDHLCEQKIGRSIPKYYQFLWQYVIPYLIVILLGMQIW